MLKTESETWQNTRSKKKSKIFPVFLGSELSGLGRMWEEKAWHSESFSEVTSMQWQLRANRIAIKKK